MQRNALLLARFFALITTGLGLVAAFGWIGRQPQLFRFDPAFTPVPFSVAFGFVLVGAVLVLLTFGWRCRAAIAAALVTALGPASALQFYVGGNFGIDTLFLEPLIGSGMPPPGRMAPNTALLFVVWGIVAGAAGLPALDRRRWCAAAVCGGLIVGYIVIVLIGYLGGVEPSYRWSRYASMAPQAAVGFLFAAAALICLAEDQREPGERGGTEFIVHLPLRPGREEATDAAE